MTIRAPLAARAIRFQLGARGDSRRASSGPLSRIASSRAAIILRDIFSPALSEPRESTAPTIGSYRRVETKSPPRV